MQRDVLLEIIDLDKGTMLTCAEFDQVWEQIRPIDNRQNLLCEMLVRCDLTLDNWSVLYHPIVDLGARALLYYVGLEGQLAIQRQFDNANIEVRPVKVDDHQAIFQQFDATMRAQLAESRRKELTN